MKLFQEALIHVYRNDTLVSSYAYDANGNRASFTNQSETITGTCDNQDRMLTCGDASYGYNKSGSLTFKAENGDTTFYSYDNLGNLISVKLPDGTFIEYLIDGQNRRIGRKVNGRLQKGWLYQDQLNPVAELDSLGNILSRFVYANKGHVPDYMVQGDSTYRFITDHLGSVRLVVNVESGQIAQRIDYDEFGNILINTNPDFQPFGYAGGLTDSHTGLVRFGARDYDAEVGRWTAKDPIGFEDGINFYLYASNDPINLFDPYGLWYININVTFGVWAGVTGGLIITQEGVFTYFGVGSTTPKASIAITYSPGDFNKDSWTGSMQFTGGLALSLIENDLETIICNGPNPSKRGFDNWEIGLGVSFPTFWGASLTGQRKIGWSDIKSIISYLLYIIKNSSTSKN